MEDTYLLEENIENEINLDHIELIRILFKRKGNVTKRYVQFRWKKAYQSTTQNSQILFHVSSVPKN